jgi:hypothetical protein
MDIARGPVAHSARKSIFDTEAVWRLGPDALEIAGGAGTPGAATQFPYVTVRELRLSFDPTRFDTNRYRCDLRFASGAALTIYSTHYVGVGEFEDRAATYGPLVRELIARVAAANPACSFKAGKTLGSYWGELIFLLAMVLLLAFVLGLVGGVSLSALVVIKLGIIAVFVPIMISYARKNRPRGFNPAVIPEDVLPEVPRQSA